MNIPIVSNQLITLQESKKLKLFHIILIILGTIFILLSTFQQNLWFDESYSVSIAGHSFKDIWKYGSHDVHPILYYWMLHILSLVFGQNIIIFRLFSAVPVILMAILGLTHIKKDFTSKIGILFTFFSLFLPFIADCASSIRMYTWTMLLVTLTTIYANRILKHSSYKNWILFAIFSLASAYTHYYGLMAAGLINLALFIYFIKHRHTKRKRLIYFCMSAFAQILLYLPWIVCFFKQVSSVSKGFWISFDAGTIISLINVQFKGSLDSASSFIIAIIFFGYLISLWKTLPQKQYQKEVRLCLALYLGVMLAALLLSIITPILFSRYLIAITGPLILLFAIVMGQDTNKHRLKIVCTVIFIASCLQNILLMQKSYDKGNMAPISYLKSVAKPEDIFVFNDIGLGSLPAVFLPEYHYYFHNIHIDGIITEAYMAFQPQMKMVENLDFLSSHNGRFWIIDNLEHDMYHNYFKNNPNYQLDGDITCFETKYHNIHYIFIPMRNISNENKKGLHF